VGGLHGSSSRQLTAKVSPGWHPLLWASHCRVARIHLPQFRSSRHSLMNLSSHRGVSPHLMAEKLGRCRRRGCLLWNVHAAMSSERCCETFTRRRDLYETDQSASHSREVVPGALHSTAECFGRLQVLVT